MESRKILGVLILIIMVAAFLTAVIASTWRPTPREETIIENYTLEESQVSGVKNVNIIFDSNSTGYVVTFSNETSLVYNIQTERDWNSSKPRVDYRRNGETLNVEIKMGDGAANIILSNKYLYNASLRNKVGGFTLILSNDSRIDTLNSSIQYAGGGMVVLDKTTFNKINMYVNSGGFYIKSVKPAKGLINVTARIGGVTMDIESPGNQAIRIVSGVELGGITFKPEGFNILKNTTNSIEIQTPLYKTSKMRLEIACKVGLGGVSINTFSMPTPV